MNSMIKGFWQTTTLVCANQHGDQEVVMTIQQGPKNMFYACPKYHPENRSEGECSCANRISIKEYETMLSKIFTVLEKADESNTVLNLANFAWKNRGIEFKVILHTNTDMKISVLNPKALL